MRSRDDNDEAGVEEEASEPRRMAFERHSLDKYRDDSPPSLTDQLRQTVQQYAERNSVRLCRRGIVLRSVDGSTYRPPCRNRWSCPLCSPLRLEDDRYRIAKVLQAHRGVLSLTFTVADRTGPPTAETLVPLMATWNRAFMTGSWFTDFRARTGMVGWVRSIEMTFPENSTHPHLHVAFTFEGRVSSRVVDELRVRWVSSASAAGVFAHIGSQKGHVKARGAQRESTAWYLTEQNAIRESRKGHGRTPGDLLHSVAQTGNADDLQLLLGFHEAVAGRRKISTSRGFWNL